MAKSSKPGAIIVGGERWGATVLQVVDRDPDGSPRTLRLLRDDESVKVEGGEEFFVVYASPALRKRKN